MYRSVIFVLLCVEKVPQPNALDKQQGDNKVLSSSLTAPRPNRPRSMLEDPWVAVITILVTVIVK